MLIGEFVHSIDEKGRTSLPAKFKNVVKGKVFITKGMDTCLSVYMVSSWNKLLEKLNNLSITKDKERGFNRFILSGASDMTVDKQGRVLIPSNLREFANLKKKIVWIGVGDKAEVWSEEN